jgi:hypothetical protein
MKISGPVARMALARAGDRSNQWSREAVQLADTAIGRARTFSIEQSSMSGSDFRPWFDDLKHLVLTT